MNLVWGKVQAVLKLQYHATTVKGRYEKKNKISTNTPAKLDSILPFQLS